MVMALMMMCRNKYYLGRFGYCYVKYYNSLNLIKRHAPQLANEKQEGFMKIGEGCGPDLLTVRLRRSRLHLNTSSE